MKSLLTKHLIGIISTIIALLLTGGLFTLLLINNSLPDYTGNLEIEGIKSSVKVLRDDNNIPYIIGENDEDLFTALGFVHAQDRLYQMEILRRAAIGELSTIFNEADSAEIVAMHLGLEFMAKENFSRLDDKTKLYYINYANGINEYIKEYEYSNTPEFSLLDIKERMWKAEDVFAIEKLFKWLLNSDWRRNVVNYNIYYKTGAEKFNELGTDKSFPELLGNMENLKKLDFPFVKLDSELRKYIGVNELFNEVRGAVVSSDRSESGECLFGFVTAGAYTNPVLWYPVIMNGKNIEVAGFTLPGLPFVINGVNDSFAWFNEFNESSTSDFYIEKLDTLQTHYYVDDELWDLRSVTDTIYYEDEKKGLPEFNFTHRGAVEYKVWDLADSVSDKWYNLSFRWLGVENYKSANAFVNLMSYKGLGEIISGFDNNGLYNTEIFAVDRANNMFDYQFSILPDHSKTSDYFIKDGNKISSDWKGFRKGLSNKLKKKDDIIYSVNEGKSDIKSLLGKYSRLDTLFSRKEKYSQADIKQILFDNKSYYAEAVCKHLLDASEGVKINDENMNYAIHLIKNYDSYFGTESQTPLIISAFINELIKSVFRDEMGEDLFNDWFTIPYEANAALLYALNNNTSWLDNINTADKIEQKKEVLLNALANALGSLEDKYGSNIAEWQYKKAHLVKSSFYYSENAGTLRKLKAGGEEYIGGDLTCINNTASLKSNSYGADVVSLAGLFYDGNSPNYIEMYLPTGVSSNVFSSSYNKDANFDVGASCYRLPVKRNIIENSGFKQFVLNPVY